MEKSLVSIIILNWNKRELLKKCLSSIKRNVEYPDYEVIVVDNNSSDESVEMVKKCFPNVKIVENPENYGYAKGNNEGVKVSKGIPFILSNDTMVQRGAVTRMVQVLTSDEDIGVVGGALFTLDGQVQQFNFFFATNSILSAIYSGLHERRARKTFLRSAKSRAHKGGMEVDRVLGAALMIKRKVVNEVGMFYEPYFALYDEQDLCYRVRRAGYKVVWVPDAKIIHLHGATAPLGSKWRSDLIERNRLLFRIRAYPLVLPRLKAIFLYLIGIPRALILSFLYRDRRYLQVAQSKIKAFSYVKREAEPPKP